MVKKIVLYWVVSCAILFFSSVVNATTFTEQPLSKVFRHRLMARHDWHNGCPVSLDRLSLLTLSYYDFSGHEQEGHLIVLDAAAPFMLQAFKHLYQLHYPLEKLGATSDEATSAFNCRSIVGEKRYSLHAYGLAIDINISRNPYLGSFKINEKGYVSGQLVPNTAKSYSYLNRAIQRPGMNEKIVDLMAKSGFIVWGGQWQDRVDYQHFQVPNNMAFHLSYLDRASGEKMMSLLARYPVSAKKMSSDSKWFYLYQLYPKDFIRVFSHYFPLLEQHAEDEIFNLVYQTLSLR